MQFIQMNRAATAALLLALAFSSAAWALGNPYGHRHTLFVSLGQQRLKFEAPKGMCFLDASDPTEGGVLSGMKSAVESKGNEVLVAVFADCKQAEELANGTSPFTLPDAGVIRWMNPYVGETTPMSKQDYLDMREASFKEETRKGIAQVAKTKMDNAVHRTADTVSIAFISDTELNYQKFTTVGISASTLIGRIPVDFTINHTTPAKAIPSTTQLYPMMDKFVAQQITLNK